MTEQPSEILKTELTLHLGATLAVTTTASGFTDWDRFWTKVDKNGPWVEALGSHCWPWTAAKNNKGYGMYAITKRDLVCSHVFSYWIHFGTYPPRMVDHRCHHRECVNPRHLRLASSKQNNENRAGANKNSRSGIRGVIWHLGRWEGRITHNHKSIYLGRFSTCEEAEAAVVNKRRELFTHNDIDRLGAVCDGR
jgi:hypothetical protein